jgi:putative nucleotidyltransferase with HDIG domain
VYEGILKSEHLKIYSVSNGFDACNIAKKHHIDIALIDLIMPGLSGIDTLKRLKEIDENMDIVVITAYGSMNTAIEAMKNGAYDYLHKPVAPDKLKTTIRNIVQKRELSFKLDRKMAELAAIYESTNIMRSSSSKDIDDIAELIMDTIVKIMQADEGSLMLLDKDTNELYIKVGRGIPEDIIKNKRVKIGEDVAGWVVKHNEPLLLIGGISKDPRFAKLKERKEIRSALCVPLCVSNRVIGVLNLNRIYIKQDFTKEDLTLLSIFAAEISGAIERSETYATLEEKIAELTQLNLKLEDLFLDTVKALSSAIDAKDPYTLGHSSQVQKYVLAIAEEMGLREQEKKQIGIIGLLHDIGKIGIKDGILSKPGLLTHEEWDIIKKHPSIGAGIIKHIEMFDGIAEAILYHHERYDGTGYPYRLKGEQIPLMSRIMAVADAFDAMTSKRPYRKPMTREEAIKELKINSGTQFDPKVVNAFLKVLEREEVAIKKIEEIDDNKVEQ